MLRPSSLMSVSGIVSVSPPCRSLVWERSNEVSALWLSPRLWVALWSLLFCTSQTVTCRLNCLPLSGLWSAPQCYWRQQRSYVNSLGLAKEVQDRWDQGKTSLFLLLLECVMLNLYTWPGLYWPGSNWRVSDHEWGGAGRGVPPYWPKHHCHLWKVTHFLLDLVRELAGT